MPPGLHESFDASLDLLTLGLAIADSVVQLKRTHRPWCEKNRQSYRPFQAFLLSDAVLAEEEDRYDEHEASDHSSHQHHEGDVRRQVAALFPQHLQRNMFRECCEDCYEHMFKTIRVYLG